MHTRDFVTATASAFAALAIYSCGGPALDAMDAMVDGMVDDASAQSCASCNAGGAVRMVTADTDPDRLESGITTADEDGQPDPFVLAGPFVLTDAIATAGTGRTFLYLTDCDGPEDCAMVPLADGAIARLESNPTEGEDRGLQGVRIVVPAGRILCASKLSGGEVLVRWAGFRPY